MTKTQHTLPSNGEIIAARDVITTFLTSMKNYDLYPHDHALSQKFLENIHHRLDNFLARYGEFKIIIEQKLLLYKSVPIYEVESTEDNFAFLLYRDGLLWIEFLPGLTFNEIDTFLSILNKYKVLHDEPEDDIVTALWDEDMAHIRYDAKELFFDDVPLLDFSKLNKVPMKESAGSAREETSGPASPESGNILDMVTKEGFHQLWSLSPQEFETLKTMVRKAEKDIRTGDVLQALFFVLNKQDNAEEFAVVLDFVKEELQTEIGRGNFGRVTHHLTALKKLAESPQQGREWVVELLDRLFDAISNESILDYLESGLAHLNWKDTNQLANLFFFLLQLEPQAIISLGNLLPSIKAQEVLDLFFVVMVKLGRRDIVPLGALLANKDDRISLIATQVLSKITGEESRRLLVQALQHPSSKVRRQALRFYLATDCPRLEIFFHLIDDPEVTIRTMLLSFLSSERNEHAERLLLAYLKNESCNHMDENHVVACYRALGCCGSKLSLPFLEKTLLDNAWNSVMNRGKIVQQHGAITALTRLQIDEATEILQKGAASFVPALRKSCRSALEHNDEGA